MVFYHTQMMNIITPNMEDNNRIVHKPKKGPKMRPDVLLLLVAISTPSNLQNCTEGSHPLRKTVKKADNVCFGRPPPLNGYKADICCLKKAHKS